MPLDEEEKKEQLHLADPDISKQHIAMIKKDGQSPSQPSETSSTLEFPDETELGAKNKLRCNICAKTFVNNWSLNRHKIIHTGEKPFQCVKCEKAFSQKGELNRHMAVHTGEKPYKCKVCEKSFSQKEHLNKHMVVHTGEKPYSCEKCGKSYAHSGSLKDHKKNCKGISSSQQYITAPEIKSVDCGEIIKQETKEGNEIGDNVNLSDHLITAKVERN